MMRRAVIIYWMIFVAFLIPFILGKNVIALAESFHDLIDALTITFSYYVTRIVNNSSSVYTYGLHRLEVLSAVINLMIIIFGSIFTLYLSLIFCSSEYSLLTIILSMIVIPLLLSIENEDEKDFNKKSVVLHSLFDILSYIIGILVLIVYHITSINIVILLGVISIVILSIFMSINPLKQSFLIMLEGSPINTNELEKDLKGINPGVHHIHVWAICGHIKVATIHVEVNENMTVKEIDVEREKIQRFLKEKYDIDHVTIQFESKKVD